MRFFEIEKSLTPCGKALFLFGLLLLPGTRAGGVLGVGFEPGLRRGFGLEERLPPYRYQQGGREGAEEAGVGGAVPE